MVGFRFYGVQFFGDWDDYLECVFSESFLGALIWVTGQLRSRGFGHPPYTPRQSRTRVAAVFLAESTSRVDMLIHKSH